MGEDRHYTIGELARAAGVTPRTVRYYTAEGLLPPPDARGRYARYGPEHLRRLGLIAELKAAYLPLSAIRQRLDAAEQGRPLPRAVTSRVAEAPGRYEARAAPQGAQMRAEGDALHPEPLPDPFRLAPAGLTVGRAEFFPDAAEGQEPPEEPGANRGRPTSERWLHLIVAPGVEVRLREPVPPARRRKVERMIAALRDELLGEDER